MMHSDKKWCSFLLRKNYAFICFLWLFKTLFILEMQVQDLFSSINIFLDRGQGMLKILE